MNNNELKLRTAFVCMVSDGKIHEDELTEIRNIFSKRGDMSSEDIDEKLSNLLSEFNESFDVFLFDYFQALRETTLTKGEQIDILKTAYSIFSADKDLSYSEVKLFKAIKGCFQIENSLIEESIEGIDEMFLLEDIKQDARTLIEGFMISGDYASLKNINLIQSAE